jgi:bifunctional ADP-heptose synthase (sugar kinase/adenylyltransferase)
MDTRSKIITLEHAINIAKELQVKSLAMKVVTGHFDVLVADHIRRLREIANGAGALFVVILDPSQPLLPMRARAELVAGLTMVDYVVPVEEAAAEALLCHFTTGEIVREESADLLRARRLSEHVQRRHQQ